jgi:hypothetical protein
MEPNDSKAANWLTPFWYVVYKLLNAPASRARNKWGQF